MPLGGQLPYGPEAPAAPTPGSGGPNPMAMDSPAGGRGPGQMPQTPSQPSPGQGGPNPRLAGIPAPVTNPNQQWMNRPVDWQAILTRFPQLAALFPQFGQSPGIPGGLQQQQAGSWTVGRPNNPFGF